MKKTHIIIIISTSALAVLLLVTALVSCAISGNDSPNTEESTSEIQKLENVTEADKPEEVTTGTYTTPNYNSTPSTSKQTEKATEATTEGRTTEESETEKETETEVGSFVFVSNGNGTCTLTSIGEIENSCVIIPEKSPSGEVVTSIADRAFYGQSGITAIQISSTISSIGEMAFGSCRDLVYISVQSENKNFKDINGVLYSYDESRLIAYPQGKEAVSFSISDKVRRIEAMAFYECQALRTIEYAGSAVDWSELEIGKFNYALYAVSINCKGNE